MFVYPFKNKFIDVTFNYKLILPHVLIQALDTFNTAVVSPIYYAMFTSLTILASAIMFKVRIVLTTFSIHISGAVLIC